MAQFGRPNGDKPAGLLDPWSDDPWWSKLDETVASDGDYIEADSPGMNGRVRLTALLPPGVNTGHTLRIRTGMTSGSTNGNVSIENAGGVTRASYTADALAYGTSFTTVTWNLTSGEAANILDSEYAELYVRFQAYGTGARVSWIELEIPDASAIDALLSDALELTLDGDFAKTVQPELDEGVTLSVLAPGLNDPERLIDAGRMFRVKRTLFSPGSRSALIDFEDL